MLTLGGMTIGRATYDPGGRWPVHVGRAMNKTLCDVEHVGMVVSGRATAAMADGTFLGPIPLQPIGRCYYAPVFAIGSSCQFVVNFGLTRFATVVHAGFRDPMPAKRMVLRPYSMFI